MKPLRAYSVLETSENTGGILFGRHRIAVHKAGANEYGDGDLSSVTCHRAPWADAYADKATLPARVLIAHGWHFECHGCGARIDEDFLRHRRFPLSGVCGDQHGWVHCSPRCKARHMRLRARRKAAEREAFEAFKAIVLKRFPDADIIDFADRDARCGSHVYVCEDRGQWHWQQIHVAFRFPGMEIGPAHYRRDEPFSRGGRNCIGPALAWFTCCNGDREAFERYASAGRAAS